MPVNDLNEKLTQAFVDLFADNVFDFGDGFKGGGPGYYGVRLENVDAGVPAVDLALKFRSGVPYCCFEFSCHFAFYKGRGWSRLRACLDRRGLGDFPLPVLRKVRAVIERGAAAKPSPKTALCIMEASEHETGPFRPLLEDGT